MSPTVTGIEKRGQGVVAVTIDDVGRVGPTGFNVKYVCEALEIAPSLINHHFGGRDELLAEATELLERELEEELLELDSKFRIFEGL